MTFTGAIKTCFSKYADFNGRATRSEYWWYVLFIVLVSIVLSEISGTLSVIFTLVTLLPSLAVGARRLHDTNRSGWLLLLNLIPIVGWLIVLYFVVQESKEPNRFGSAPLLE